MSAKLAVAPSLVTLVLSVTLMTRGFLPAVVNVLADASTEATEPRKPVARGAFSSAEADDEAVPAEPLAVGDGEASFCGAAEVVNVPQSAKLATIAPVMRFDFFMSIVGFVEVAVARFNDVSA